MTVLGDIPKGLLSDERIDSIVETLSTQDSRQAVEEILDETKLGRAQLVQVLKHVDQNVESSDTVARLKAKLVESTVGYKLRSQAIRGGAVPRMRHA